MPGLYYLNLEGSGIIWSAELPDKETDRAAVQKDAAVVLVGEVRTEIDAADDVPSSLELLFKPFFNVLGGVLEVLQLAANYLRHDVFRDQQCVLLHVCFHVAVTNVQRQRHVRADPVLWDSGTSRLLFLLVAFLCLLLRLGFFHKFQLYSNLPHAPNHSSTRLR